MSGDGKTIAKVRTATDGMTDNSGNLSPMCSGREGVYGQMLTQRSAGSS
jgi:hypothetical protein